MGEQTFGRHRSAHAAAVVVLAGFVAACSSEPPVPAPVFLKGGAAVPSPAPAPRIVAAPPRAPAPIAPAPREARRIVVRPGQSVGALAREFHVPQHAIIAANHLTSPYKVEIGQQLLIPGAAGEPIREAAAPARPRPPAPTAAHASSEIIPLDGPGPGRPSPPPAATASAPDAHPEEHRRPPAAANELPVRDAAEPNAPERERVEPATRSERSEEGHFPWPVHGRVLAGYGVGAGGVHNDGINIAAPRGAPVKAVGAGVVAYAGNELRGYGNLVLIKHPNGFISAYAHCEELLVKRGERVRSGQVIARVGETGGVREPQLHFELRRGKEAVDPRDFLVPAPSAWKREDADAG